MKTIQRLWEERSRKYSDRIEGVLPKSLPKILNEYLDRWMYESVRCVISKHEELKILDLGCGYGRLSEKILQEFPQSRTFGVDISEEYVGLYNKRLSPRGKAMQGDIKKLRFRNNHFDVVLMVTTLMYVVRKSEQGKSLAELLRVLRPGGKFVIIERTTKGHNLFTIWGLIPRIRGAQAREIPSVSFEPKYLVNLVEGEGGQVVRINGIPAWTLCWPVLFLMSLLSKRLTRILLTWTKLLDKGVGGFAAPFSLYVSYVGKKV